MAISAGERSLLERFKQSPAVRALTEAATGKARTDRGKLVEEHGRLVREGINGGPVVALVKADNEAKAALDDARSRLKAAEERQTATGRSVRDALDGRGNRVGRLEDLLVQSAPPSLRDFLQLSKRIANDVRVGRIPLRVGGFKDPTDFGHTLLKVSGELRKELYTDHDPSAIEARVEAAMLRFRFDLHKVVADVPERVTF